MQVVQYNLERQMGVNPKRRIMPAMRLFMCILWTYTNGNSPVHYDRSSAMYERIRNAPKKHSHRNKHKELGTSTESNQFVTKK